MWILVWNFKGDVESEKAFESLFQAWDYLSAMPLREMPDQCVVVQDGHVRRISFAEFLWENISRIEAADDAWRKLQSFSK